MTSDGSRATDAPLRIGLFNVKYSPNLGDGLLSESLESELRELVPGLTTRAFDLAGREAYTSGARMRGTALKLLQNSPTPVRHTVVKTVLGHRLRQRIRPAWRRELGGIDVAVVGGGNLFGDTDLNFPLKIDAALAEVRAAGVPAAVFAVGVSDNWSTTGEDLFRRALADTRLVYASVRDRRSADIWNRKLGRSGIEEASIVRDPGLLVSRHVRGLERKNGSPPLIGIGLTHPIALTYHADEDTISESALTAWYIELLRACLARGWRISVFTNGSPEDEDYLQTVRDAWAALDTAGSVTFESRFARPSDLARYISGLDLMLAHRLHANIAAFSYRVPHIGFSWDAKLKSFLTDVGRGAFLCTAGISSIEDTIALAERALKEGVSVETHRRVIDAARSDVRKLADILLATRSGRGRGARIAR